MSCPAGSLPRAPAPSSPYCLVLNPSYLCPNPLALLKPILWPEEKDAQVIKQLSFPHASWRFSQLEYCRTQKQPHAIPKPLDPRPHLNLQPRGASYPPPLLQLEFKLPHPFSLSSSFLERPPGPSRRLGPVWWGGMVRETWIWRSENQGDGVRNWNGDGEIGYSGSYADGDWGAGNRKCGDGP